MTESDRAAHPREVLNPAPDDVEDVHPDIRAAMRRAGIEVAEPGLYDDDEG